MLFISSASSFPRLRSPDGAAVVCQLHRTFTGSSTCHQKTSSWHLKDDEKLLFAAIVLACPLSGGAGPGWVAGAAAPQPATAAQRPQRGRLRAAGRRGGGGGLGAHHVHGEFHQGDAGMKTGKTLGG